MIKSIDDRRVETVLNAFDTLFNKRDYASAERFWSPRYIQHSAHIPPGRDGLFGLVRTLPATLRYENHVAAATGDFVILHGRFSGPRPAGGVDRRRHCAHGRWSARGALGRHPRTKPRGSNRAAVCRCSAINSRPDRDRRKQVRARIDSRGRLSCGYVAGAWLRPSGR